ncbi:MAG: hypothetical protein KBF37_06720 [Saprospiraceae bacterium]|jgi:hypothetical protein|nr:hypothetical protein [Saprospiraceae bacterium]MBP9209995.1 hypothetical protein [Saprospiraceae bacterium]MBV6473248.1 hypothetical protein [Saprospiraceae bacterium]
MTMISIPVRTRRAMGWLRYDPSFGHQPTWRQRFRKIKGLGRPLVPVLAGALAGTLRE